MGKQKEPRAELRQGGRGLAAAELSLSRRHRPCRCNSVKHFIIKYGNLAVWTLIWLLPQHRCYTQPKKVWARWGRWHHRRISEWSFRIAWKLHVHCVEKCETRSTRGLCTVPQNYQLNANTCCQLYLLTGINPSQMNHEPFDDPHPNRKTLENKGGGGEGVGCNVWLFFSTL